MADDELTQPTPHPKLRIAIARKADALWVKRLLKWIESCQDTDENTIKKQLAFWVEEYVESTSAAPSANMTSLTNTIH